MHDRLSKPLRREPFSRDSGAPAEGKWEQAILRLLLAQDGSTTRLLETMTGAAISVHVVDQHLVGELPGELDGLLPGDRFLRRVTSLHAAGHVLLDSLAYIAIDALPPPVVQELEEGIRPIGHVLSDVWTRRTRREQDRRLLEELWSAVGEPDLLASRSQCIHTLRAPCMLLAETFRRGVLAHIR